MSEEVQRGLFATINIQNKKNTQSLAKRNFRKNSKFKKQYKFKRMVY